VVAPWALFAWVYFGSPVPHSIIAKSEITLGPGFVKYLPWFLDSLGFTFFDDATPVEFALWLGLVLAGVAALLFRREANRTLRMVALFPPLFAATLALGKAPWFPWYLVPVTWCALVLGVIGGHAILAMLTTHPARPSWSRAALPVMAGFAIAVLALGLALRDVALFTYWRKFQQNEDATRRRAGEWIENHTSPGASVAMEAIGYEGTYSRRRVVDLAGVISPQVVSIHRASRSNGETFERVLQAFAPEAVVIRTYEFEQNRHMMGGPLFETREARARFLDEYEKALELTAPNPDIWGDNASIMVWHRK
jgi:hypothetical protein